MSHIKSCDIVQDLSAESGSANALIAFSWCVAYVTKGFKPLLFVGQGRWDLEMSLTVPKGPACVPHRLCHVTNTTETLGAAGGQEGPTPREVQGFPLSPRRSLFPYISEKAPFSPFPLPGAPNPPAPSRRSQSSPRRKDRPGQSIPRGRRRGDRKSVV